MAKVKSDLKEFNELHPNRKLAIFGIILFVFVISILVGIYFSRSQQSQETADTGSDTETVVEQRQTFYTLVPDSETVAVGETVTVSVMLDGDPVTVADVKVDFDPEIFRPVSITNGDAFESLVREEIDAGQGWIDATATVDLSNTSDIRTGEILSFTLEAIAPGSSQLSFDLDRTIAAINNEDTLQDVQGITISAE